MSELRLGKRPATYSKQDLRLARYTVQSLPAVPKTDLGWYQSVRAWDMLGNDRYGDCVLAGAAHETLLWAAIGGERGVGFRDQDVLGDYSAITGFDPSDPSTDQGTDMRAAAAYRQKVGVRDANGRRHKVAAYVAMDPGAVDQLKLGVYLFGAVGVGIEFPGSAMDQFNAGKPWTVVRGASVEGGHYVPVVGYDRGADMFVCVTWGRAQRVAPTFLKKYMDEGFAYLSQEALKAGKSPVGLDLAALRADLTALGKL